MAVLTPDESLHAALGRAVAAACGPRVHVTAVEPLTGDASTRRYVRVRLAGDDAPATLVAMILGEGRFAPGSDELGGGIGIDELPFVNVGRWLAARGFPVPALRYDGARAAGLLLLEDIGDETLWRAASAAPARAVDWFAAAIDLLVALQAAGARHPDPTCYAFRRRFDRALALREVEHFIDHGIETRTGERLGAALRGELIAALAPLLEPFTTPAPVLVHRDFMAWNLHVQGTRLRLIDFQDALLGPDAYDVAALLTDRTTSVLIDEAAERQLLERFAARRAEAGLPAAADLTGGFARCALHRALKVIGRFHFLEVVQGKPGYLAYLPGVYAVARRMFGRLPGLGDIQRRLATWVPELAPDAA